MSLSVSVPKSKSKFKDVHIAWANGQSWNAGVSDAEVFPLADEDGVFVGEIEGKPVTCITGMKYHDTAFIGFYICDEKYRGKGHGIATFQKAIDHCGSANIGLDGVVEQQHNYEKFGLRKVWDNIRFHGVAKSLPAPALPSSVTMVDLTQAMYAKVQEFELQHSGMRRPDQFIKAWLEHPLIKSIVLVSGEAVVGFGSVRPSHSGHRIGPLYAADIEVAGYLAAALVAKLPSGDSVYADVCMANDKSAGVFENAGLSGEGGFVTGRMWTKGCPVKPQYVHNVYAVMTLEIG
ncbi:hypothetical protein HK101_004881 [Irineochytrium annulatum]|nr:hypothetical protein HK101_004881 [Irineochytrium annulatum]